MISNALFGYIKIQKHIETMHDIVHEFLIVSVTMNTILLLLLASYNMSNVKQVLENMLVVDHKLDKMHVRIEYLKLKRILTCCLFIKFGVLTTFTRNSFADFP